MNDQVRKAVKRSNKAEHDIGFTFEICVVSGEGRQPASA
jgi:hypothetical protein